MYKKAWCMCRVAILLIKPIAFWRSCCRHRRSFVRSLLSDLSERRSFKTFCLWKTSSIRTPSHGKTGRFTAWVNGTQNPVPFTEERSRKPGTGIKDGFQRMVLKLLLGIFHPEKQNYFHRWPLFPKIFRCKSKRRVALTFQPDFFG